MTHCCWESAALSRRRHFLPIVWVALDVCDFIIGSYQLLNSPRLIYYFSNMTSRLSGNISVFGLVLIVLKSLLETARQCSLEKFAILSLKPRSHVTILIHRTWVTLRNWFTWHKIKYFIAFWIHSSNSKRKRKKKKAEFIGIGWRYAPCRRTFLFCKTHQLLSIKDKKTRWDGCYPGSSLVFPIYWRQTKRRGSSLLSCRHIATREDPGDEAIQ